MLDVIGLAQECAPSIHPNTIAHVIRAESDFNPFAIGVVDARLARQPRNLEEAVATVNWLEANGYNYSVGLMQVNKNNFARYKLTAREAFTPCSNLRAGSAILQNCFERAKKTAGASTEQIALRHAFSCYYSNNFVTGYKDGYVQRVIFGPVLGAKVAANSTSVSNRYKPRSSNSEDDTTSAIAF